MKSIINQIQLIGNVGQDPKLTKFDNGNALCRFSLATHEYRRNSEGESEKITHWFNIVSWGKLAEFMEADLEKGSRVAIKGKLVNRSYVTKEGEDRQSVEIIANEHMVLDRKKVA